MILSRHHRSSSHPSSSLCPDLDLIEQDKENHASPSVQRPALAPALARQARKGKAKSSLTSSSARHLRSHSVASNTRRSATRHLLGPYARPPIHPPSDEVTPPPSPEKLRNTNATRTETCFITGARTLAQGSSGPVVYDRGKALLPLSLPRPGRMAYIDTESVEGIEGVPFIYVQERLAAEGPNLLQAALAARLCHSSGHRSLAPPLPNTLTFEFTAQRPAFTPRIPSMYASGPVPPNYCLAVRKTPQFPTASSPATAGTILPVHDIVYRTACAHLPPIPSRSPLLAPECLPVIHLTLPSPSTLPTLNTFLYTQRTDILLSSLLDVPTGHLGSPTPTSRSGLTSVMASKVELEGLMDRVSKVHGVWANTCSLGIADPNLWKALDTAWEVLVGAIAIVQIRSTSATVV